MTTDAQDHCHVCAQPVQGPDAGRWVAFQAMYVFANGNAKLAPGVLERNTGERLVACHETCLHMLFDGMLAEMRAKKPRVAKGKPQPQPKKKKGG